VGTTGVAAFHSGDRIIHMWKGLEVLEVLKVLKVLGVLKVLKILRC